MSDLLLSVVIPTRNHRTLLERLLRSISQQSLDPSKFEVVVVDDGSTDGSSTMLKNLSPLFSLTVLDGGGIGPPEARNKGAHHSRAPVVAFFDDDVTLRPDCFERVLPYFEDPGIGIVETNLMIEGTDRPLQRNASEQGFVTAAIFLRRKAFEKAGGLDPDFFDPESGNFFRDDTNLGFRVLDAGYRAVQPADVVAWHPVLFSDIRGSFAHVRRYMFDPLLYRKHPELFRRYVERKKVGPFVISRPMHYSCIAYVLSLLAGATFLAIGQTWTGVVCGFFAAGLLTIIRYKFQGTGAVRIWRFDETLAYMGLPFWYLYWFIRGCLKYGGWKSLF